MEPELIETFLHNMAKMCIAKAARASQEGTAAAMATAVHNRGFAHGLLVAWSILHTGDTDAMRGEIERMEKEAGL